MRKEAIRFITPTEYYEIRHIVATRTTDGRHAEFPEWFGETLDVLHGDGVPPL